VVQSQFQWYEKLVKITGDSSKVKIQNNSELQQIYFLFFAKTQNLQYNLIQYYRTYLIKGTEYRLNTIKHKIVKIGNIFATKKR